MARYNDGWGSQVFGGTFWLMAWLFTIGFAELSFWEGVFAFFIWPYYIGTTFR